MNAQCMLQNPNGRQQERTKMRARIKMTHPATGELLVLTDNLSDGGLFILNGDYALPPVGEIIKLQVQDVPFEAPTLYAKIVRRNDDGIGVMFV